MDALKYSRFLLAVIATALVAACGGSSGGGSTGNALIPDPPGTSFRLGTLNADGSFDNGSLDMTAVPLSAGGATTIAVNIVDGDRRPHLDEVEVRFTSTCAARGEADIDSPITTSGSRASTIYTATGCSGQDIISAEAEIDGDILRASGPIQVASANVGQVEFVRAEPEVLALRNTGSSDRPESASVTFRVLGTDGSPRRDQLVSFSAQPTGGDIEIFPESAVTDSQGLVNTRVRAGRLPTPFRVVASLPSLNIATQSSLISIGTGIPHQDGVSLARTIFNPEAWNIDGLEVDFTVRLVDQFGNPVADGTRVNFITEGGQIEQSCAVEDGACSVIWTSGSPRPADGRVTVLAYAVGEETLLDKNAINNAIRTGRGLVAGVDYEDISEAFRDDSWTGFGEPRFEPGQGQFIDYNNDGVFNGPNGMFNSVLCNLDDGRPIPGCADELLHVFKQRIVVLSGSEAVIEGRHDTAAGGYRACNALPILSIQNNAIGRFSLRIADQRGNPMPAGTEVEVESTLGEVQGGQNPYIWPNSIAADPLVLNYFIEGEGGSDQEGGTVTITVTTPGLEEGGVGGVTTSCVFRVQEAGEGEDEGFSPSS